MILGSVGLTEAEMKRSGDQKYKFSSKREMDERKKVANQGSTSTPLRQIHKILCFLRREHRYHEEIIVNNNYTENHYKCGDWLGFEWHLVGGYKRSMSTISNLKRKRKWDES